MRSVIFDEHINISELERLIAELDPKDPYTSLFIDYLNQKVQLSDILSSAEASAYTYVSSTERKVANLIKPDLVTFDTGRSFYYAGLTYGDNEFESLLCVNVVTPDDQYARVRVQDLGELHPKVF